MSHLLFNFYLEMFNNPGQAFQPDILTSPTMQQNQREILFLCTANSIRSQMAEGLVNSRSKDLVAHSAGILPSGYIDRHTINVMQELDIDISSNQSKPTDLFKDKNIDIVITLCATAYEQCPVWLYEKKLSAHWGFKDVSGKSKRDYRWLRDEIQAHIDRFLALYSPDATDEEIQTLLRRLMR